MLQTLKPFHRWTDSGQSKSSSDINGPALPKFGLLNNETLKITLELWNQPNPYLLDESKQIWTMESQEIWCGESRRQTMIEIRWKN